LKIKKRKKENWLQNLQLSIELRRDKEFNGMNIYNILRIELLTPTKRFGLKGGFEVSSIKG
jgi:hypothetical protein